MIQFNNLLIFLGISQNLLFYEVTHAFYKIPELHYELECLSSQKLSHERIKQQFYL